MIPNADTLPTDPDTLREMLLAERARHAEAIARVEQERDTAVGESARLRAIIQSTIAEAIRYGLGRCDGLLRFLDDGGIEIDSNVVERTIPPIALNRKNALFAA